MRLSVGLRGLFLGLCLMSSGLLAASANAASDSVTASNCIAAADMQEISAHFSQFKDLAAKGEYCLDGSPTARLLDGIMFMRKTHFTTSMPVSGDGLFSGRFANDWWGYFTGRINEFTVQDSCAKGVVAFVYFFGNSMYVCPAALTENFTALDLASVFMHEARHIDGFPHVTCNQGPRQGLQGACDSKISDGGSYAVTVETYAQLAKYGDELHPALRAYARASSVIYADEAFDTPVEIQREQQFLVMDAKRQIYKLNLSAGSELKPLGQAPELGHIVMRAQHMILIPDDKTLPARFMFARSEGETPQQAGDLAAEYNQQTSAGRAEVIDFHIGAQWTARVTSQKIRFACDPRSASTVEKALPSGEQAAGLLYPTGYDRASRVVQLLTQSGHMLEIGCDSGFNAFVRNSKMILDRPFKRVYKSGADILGLTTDGHLYRLSGEGNSLTSTPLATSADGSIVELVPNQNVEFFDGSN